MTAASFPPARLSPSPSHRPRHGRGTCPGAMRRRVFGCLSVCCLSGRTWNRRVSASARARARAGSLHAHSRMRPARMFPRRALWPRALMSLVGGPCRAAVRIVNSARRARQQLPASAGDGAVPTEGGGHPPILPGANPLNASTPPCAWYMYSERPQPSLAYEHSNPSPSLLPLRRFRTIQGLHRCSSRLCTGPSHPHPGFCV